MANYFIDRPVFAWVLAIIMMLAGGLAIMNLPVAQYPQIAPPTITISATSVSYTHLRAHETVY